MTPFSIIINRFLYKVEEDVDFFRYYQLLESEAEEVIHRRSVGYLLEATDMLASRVNAQVDFTDYNEANEIFNIELTKKEIQLLSMLMFQVYMSRSIAYLKTLEVNFTSVDLKVFDPSNARSTFLAMYEKVCKEVNELVEEYKSRDRLTGGYIGIEYSDYSSVDGE